LIDLNLAETELNSKSVSFWPLPKEK